MSLNIEDSLDDALYRHYFTELGKINSIQTVFILNNQSAYYAFTRDNIFVQDPLYEILDKQNLTLRPGLGNESSMFIFSNYYSLYKFHSIMLDSRAASISSAGEPQVLALQKRDSSIQIDTLIA